MSGKSKSNELAKEKRLQKKRLKQKRKAFLKAALAIILVLFMVGLAIVPVFSQTVPKASKLITAENDHFIYSQLINKLDERRAMTPILAASFATNEDQVPRAYDFDDVNIDMQRMIDYIEANYYKDIDDATLIEGAYKGMLDALDPHSTYFSQDEYDDFVTGLSGEFTGVGASISKSKDDYIEVVAPIKDMPAEKAGLKAGDVIVSVDGVSTLGWSTEKAVSVIRGEQGTSVVLGIRRSPSTETQNYTIVRDVIVVSTVNYRMLTDDIGYIQVTQFGEKTNSEFDEAMAYMMNKDVSDLVVDVRNNPGGYLNAAVHLSDYFVEKGRIIVKEELNDGKTQVYRATSERIPADVVVLVDGGSASASEIFSGSIQQTGAGKVIGTTTYGKGTVQVPYDMAYAGAIKLTIAEYILSGDYHVDGVGIIPDIEVKLPTEAAYLAYSAFVPMNEERIKYSGDTGLNVYGAQQRLNQLGEALTLDGKLGYNTEVALKRFQEMEGLAPTGTLTLETVAKLDAKVKALFSGEHDLQLEAALTYIEEKNK